MLYYSISIRYRPRGTVVPHIMSVAGSDPASNCAQLPQGDDLHSAAAAVSVQCSGERGKSARWCPKDTQGQRHVHTRKLVATIVTDDAGTDNLQDPSHRLS